MLRAIISLIILIILIFVGSIVYQMIKTKNTSLDVKTLTGYVKNTFGYGKKALNYITDIFKSDNTPSQGTYGRAYYM